MKKRFYLFFFTLGLTHCISIDPHTDFIVAHTALKQAKKSQADKSYPAIYAKSLSFYKKAVSFYNQENFEEAQIYFQRTIRLAEKAELKARLKLVREEL